MPEAPEKNLALDIVRITEAAALSSARWLGRGNKEAGDGAAVDAMRNSFSTLHVDGIVVIGEGEKDHAPMLYNGEKVGMGDGPQLDVAVDPVEGTSLLAYGRPNAISTACWPMAVPMPSPRWPWRRAAACSTPAPAITCRSWWWPARPAM